jgi:hypothetical protein
MAHAGGEPQFIDGYLIGHLLAHEGIAPDLDPGPLNYKIRAKQVLSVREDYPGRWKIRIVRSEGEFVRYLGDLHVSRAGVQQKVESGDQIETRNGHLALVPAMRPKAVPAPQPAPTPAPAPAAHTRQEGDTGRPARGVSAQPSAATEANHLPKPGEAITVSILIDPRRAPPSTNRLRVRRPSPISRPRGGSSRGPRGRR